MAAQHRLGRRYLRLATFVVLPWLVAVTAAACGGGAAGRPAAGEQPIAGTLTVFAASSLTDVFGEAGRQFEAGYAGVRVQFDFAASSALRLRLEQGARPDLFASADQVQIDRARDSGVLRDGGVVFAANVLVVVMPADNPGVIRSLADLAKPGLRLVLTDRNVPIGAYARQVLENLGADPAYGPDFATRVLANVRSEEANVRAALAKVQLGEADASIVYATDVTASAAPDLKTLAIPAQFNVSARYVIAVTSDTSRASLAEAFVSFLRGQRGQALLRQYGFVTGEDTGAP